jgi:hypothetical protein
LQSELKNNLQLQTLALWQVCFKFYSQGKSMKLIKNLIASAVLAGSAFGANASLIIADPIVGSSFDDVVIGTITVSTLSDITGSMFAASNVSFTTPFPFTLTLGTVTFTSTTVGTLVDQDASANGFSFQNVAAGNYIVTISGTITGGQLPNLALVGANYTVTAVPEPETFAMLLAGLGLMGAVARRRSQSTS